MNAGIVDQGVELMLFGMGTVIVFLGLLVIATTAMSRIVARFFPEPEPLPVPARAPAGTPSDDGQLVAVISAAIQQHRRRGGAPKD